MALTERDENGWRTGYRQAANRIYVQTYWWFLVATAVSVVLVTVLLLVLLALGASTGLALTCSLVTHAVVLGSAVVWVYHRQHRKLKDLDDEFREDTRAVAFQKAQRYLEWRQQHDQDQAGL